MGYLPLRYLLATLILLPNPNSLNHRDISHKLRAATFSELRTTSVALITYGEHPDRLHFRGSTGSVGTFDPIIAGPTLLPCISDRGRFSAFAKMKYYPGQISDLSFLRSISPSCFLGCQPPV